MQGDRGQIWRTLRVEEDEHGPDRLEPVKDLASAKKDQHAPPHFQGKVVGRTGRV